MKYVLDSSVGLKTILPETDSPRAIALCHEFRQGGLELLAPDVFPVEAAHALAKAERKRLLIVGEASALFDDLILPDLLPLCPSSPGPWKSLRRHVSASTTAFTFRLQNGSNANW
jgi:predicted nucleic acid-binding protein